MLYQNVDLQQNTPAMDKPTPPKSLNSANQLKVYTDLVHLYPDNEAYLRQYAELLIQHGQLTTATEALRHLYQILLTNGEPGKADALSHQYPEIGRIRTDDVQTHASIERLLPSSMRNKLWLRLHQRHIKEGQHLIRRGEQPDALYLVSSGELAEFTNGEQNRPVLLGLIGAGEIIGEHMILQSGPYPADVVANKESEVIKLPRKAMAAALIRKPALRIALQHKLDARNLMAMISISPLLQDVPLNMRKQLAEESHTRQYEPGTLIHKAGEHLSHVDLIVRGVANYQLESDGLIKRLEALKAGSLIGATSAIHDNGCAADLVSEHKVEILHIPYASFRNITEAYPPLRKALLSYAEKQQMLLMHSLDELQTQPLNHESG
ncbi:cyclic nucleotide-binding domain-containing protein [Mariprofundus ferrooxydans]|uniref:Cyclic nucleotide-binding domain-containing protein n=2 Tax=Mariprofundus ferrooxydans TaxID=314344 RepID=Q0F2H0_9PROT|nr:cyclic nucleotide-binding domain-containing protein [Mariprofundus ferrooxydans]EAU55580.1 hypothetical protein SPV1_01492 [Mariprofundus ferrooxydans PV-1]KON48681.1 hypothetical protein AL013_01545 [Mariprofundus ferrooxydans]